nr:protein kinase [Streptomyces alkaliphilus]
MDGLVLDGRYRIGQRLGEGGMGAVFEADDLRLERRVAVKVMSGVSLRRDPRAKERFDREAKVLAGLTSPYIVTVHDAGEAAVDDGTVLYLVMERLHGRSLEQVLEGGRPVRPAEVALWGEQICRGLAVAHRAGVVHRDLKPANVMVCADGLVRVLDFGIAAVLADSGDHARLTFTGLVVGTPAYMAPEQIESGGYEARSDLYALGCMLYALLTGRPPFRADALYALMRQQMLDTPEPPSALRPGLPAEWDELVLALLAKRPDARPTGAAAVADLLRGMPCPELPDADADGDGDGDGDTDGDGDGGSARPLAAAGAPLPPAYRPTRIDPRLSLGNGFAAPAASVPVSAVEAVPLGTAATVVLPPGPEEPAVPAEPDEEIPPATEEPVIEEAVEAAVVEEAVEAPVEEPPVEEAAPDPAAGASGFTGATLTSGLVVAPGALWLAPRQRMAPLPESEQLRVVLSWEVAEGAEEDPEVDASALVVDGDGTVLSDEHFVFYNNTVTRGDLSVSLVAGPGEHEMSFGVRQQWLPAGAERVVLALSLHEAEERGHTFGVLTDLSVRVEAAAEGAAESAEGEFLCGFRLPGRPGSATGLTLGELYRTEGGWGFLAASRAYPDGLVEIARAHGVNV